MGHKNPNKERPIVFAELKPGQAVREHLKRVEIALVLVSLPVKAILDKDAFYMKDSISRIHGGFWQQPTHASLCPKPYPNLREGKVGSCPETSVEYESVLFSIWRKEKSLIAFHCACIAHLTF